MTQFSTCFRLFFCAAYPSGWSVMSSILTPDSLRLALVAEAFGRLLAKLPMGPWPPGGPWRRNKPPPPGLKVRNYYYLGTWNRLLPLVIRKFSSTPSEQKANKSSIIFIYLTTLLSAWLKIPSPTPLVCSIWCVRYSKIVTLKKFYNWSCFWCWPFEAFEL